MFVYGRRALTPPAAVRVEEGEFWLIFCDFFGTIDQHCTSLVDTEGCGEHRCAWGVRVGVGVGGHGWAWVGTCGYVWVRVGTCGYV